MVPLTSFVSLPDDSVGMCVVPDWPPEDEFDSDSSEADSCTDIRYIFDGYATDSCTPIFWGG